MTSATTRSTPADRRRLARALPALRDADARAIGRFIDAAWAEHGLARQTQDAYRRDLEQLARWRDGAGGGLEGADREVLFRYMAWRHAQGYQPRSNARLRASLRAFYAHLVRAGVRADDPAALIEGIEHGEGGHQQEDPGERAHGRRRTGWARMERNAGRRTK